MKTPNWTQVAFAAVGLGIVIAVYLIIEKFILPHEPLKPNVEGFFILEVVVVFAIVAGYILGELVHAYHRIMKGKPTDHFGLNSRDVGLLLASLAVSAMIVIGFIKYTATLAPPIE